MPFQTLTRITADIAHEGSDSQAGPLTPTPPSSVLNNPRLGSNIHIQTSAMATVAVMCGMKKAARYHARAVSRWLSRTAMSTAITIATGTVKKV